MDIRDIAFHVTSQLSNLELEKLYLVGVLPELQSLAADQSWWKARVLTLLVDHKGKKTDISHLSGEWRSVYLVLERQFACGRVSFWNREDLTLPARLLMLVGYGPDSNDVLEAAREGSVSILTLVLDAIPSRALVSMDEALSLACEYGHEEVVRLLLSHPTMKGKDVSEALPRACDARWGNETGNYTRIVDMLLSLPREMMHVRLQEAIEAACEYGDNTEIVELILERCNAEVWAHPIALRCAIRKSRVSVMRLLFQRWYAADPDLVPAVRVGYGILELVLSHVYPIDRLDIGPALDQAIINEDVRCVDLLLSRPEAADIPGAQRLRWARQCGHSGIAELLRASVEQELECD